MSQNNSNAKTAMLAKPDSIHKVEGFDPSPFAVDYTDLNTQETRKDRGQDPVLAASAPHFASCKR